MRLLCKSCRSNSVILSAIIMLFAIGVLILAKHPAMYYLGAVVLVGMFSVVLMAFAVPPMLFYLLDKLPFARRSIDRLSR